MIVICDMKCAMRLLTRVHTNFGWVKWIPYRRLFTMNAVASDGPEFFLHVYACVCVFWWRHWGLYCGSKWQHNARSMTTMLEYKHDFDSITHWTRRFRFSSTNNTFDLWDLLFLFHFALVHPNGSLGNGFLCVQILFSYKIKRNNSLLVNSLKITAHLLAAQFSSRQMIQCFDRNDSIQHSTRCDLIPFICRDK